MKPLDVFKFDWLLSCLSPLAVIVVPDAYCRSFFHLRDKLNTLVTLDT